jgi:hypothetical protein
MDRFISIGLLNERAVGIADNAARREIGILLILYAIRGPSLNLIYVPINLRNLSFINKDRISDQI